MGCAGSKEIDKNAVISNAPTEATLAGGGKAKSIHALEREAEASAAAEFMGVDSTKAVVELSISCMNLTRRDRFSQSDPFCVCYVEDLSPRVKVKDPTRTYWKELGRTEIIANSPNPEWVGKFLIEYQFEVIQKLRFEVYDCDTSFATSDSSLMDLSKQDFLGHYELKLSDVCTHEQMKVIAELGGGSMLNAPFGTITVKGEEIANTTDEFKFQLQCTHLKSPIAGCNPFIVISKQNEDGGYVPCLRTEVAVGSTDPTFAEVSGPLIRIANGDVCRPLIVKVFSWKKSGRHIYIGETMCTMQMLLELAESKETLPIVNKESGRPDEEPEECGRFGAVSCSLKEKASFLDYLHGGLELNFVVAIDYTASNGNPSEPDSLHYIPSTGRIGNPYISAIQSVASVLEFYDFDREFPCYGFGAKLTKSGVVDHCFPLSGDDSNNVAVGTEGIVEQYRNMTPRLHFSGPTVFSNVVYRAASLAKSLQQTPNQKYVVLMIITDGTINDMDNCIDAIVAASTQPMSIIIVGVGDDDFSGMVKLDSDKKMLKSRTGRLAERDIVQFTALKDMKKVAEQAKLSGANLDVHDLVSRDLLAEIPAQVTEYFAQHNMPPMTKNSDNSFSRESSRLRAAEVQAVRDQIAAAQAHYGVIDAPSPQSRRSEQQRREINEMLVGPQDSGGADATGLLPTYSTVLRDDDEYDNNATREEWFDTTEEVAAPAAVPPPAGVAAAELLPSYSAVLVDEPGSEQQASLTVPTVPAADPVADGDDEWFEADDDDA